MDSGFLIAFLVIGIGVTLLVLISKKMHKDYLTNEKKRETIEGMVSIIGWIPIVGWIFKPIMIPSKAKIEKYRIEQEKEKIYSGYKRK